MSEMQVLQNVFPEMTTFEWLERAYRNARKIKRYRDEILAFSNDLDGNLLKVQKELRDETFRFEAYRRHWIYVPKKRVVMALPFYSRIAQWSIYQELVPFYDKLMIEDKRMATLKQEMDAKVKELQRTALYELLAEKDPALAVKLAEYKAITAGTSTPVIKEEKEDT